MFFIFNKQKIYSYIIALCTVSMLFFTATFLSDDEPEASQTMAIQNEQQNLNEIENKIYE